MATVRTSKQGGVEQKERKDYAYVHQAEDAKYATTDGKGNKRDIAQKH